LMWIGLLAIAANDVRHDLGHRNAHPPICSAVCSQAHVWSMSSHNHQLLARQSSNSESRWFAGGLAGLALASEALQLVNTLLLLWVLNRRTGVKSFASLVETFASLFGNLGYVAYPVYFALIQVITILPLLSAILFIVLAGSVFGAVKGTLVVSFSLSSAAAVSATISRRVAAARGFRLADLDERVAAVDAALDKRPWSTCLLLVTLLRLSPVMPFTFSNYLAGLTFVPIWVLFIGTLLGTLPTQAVYVSAGAIGRQALKDGVKVPLPVVLIGIAATAAAIFMIGQTASAALHGIELRDPAIQASPNGA